MNPKLVSVATNILESDGARKKSGHLWTQSVIISLTVLAYGRTVAQGGKGKRGPSAFLQSLPCVGIIRA